MAFVALTLSTPSNRIRFVLLYFILFFCFLNHTIISKDGITNALLNHQCATVEEKISVWPNLRYIEGFWAHGDCSQVSQLMRDLRRGEMNRGSGGGDKYPAVVGD